jgi:hypothetical protein
LGFAQESALNSAPAAALAGKSMKGMGFQIGLGEPAIAGYPASHNIEGNPPVDFGGALPG